MAYIPAVGNFVPDLEATRTLLSPSFVILVRVPLFVFSANNCTGEMWMEPSLSTIPPCGFFWLGLVWRLIIETFSTTKRSPTTRRTLPFLPLFEPVTTMTRSPLRTCAGCTNKTPPEPARCTTKTTTHEAHKQPTQRCGYR